MTKKKSPDLTPMPMPMPMPVKKSCIFSICQKKSYPQKQKDELLLSY